MYNTVTIEIAICEITHVQAPDAPTDASYIIFAPTSLLDITPNFEQVPACGYDIVNVLEWTIPDGAPITVTADNDYQLTTESAEGADHSVYTLIFKNDATYLDQVFTTSLIEFTVTVTDPCRTATIQVIELTAMTVVLGETEEQPFDEATDSAGDLYGAAVCGTRTMEIMDTDSGAVSEVVSVVEGANPGEYKVVAHSEDEAHEGTHNLMLVVTFTDYPLLTDGTYPKSEKEFTLLIEPAPCDCSLITWDNPETLTMATGLYFDPVDSIALSKSVANEDSKSASPAIRACYRDGGTCNLESTIEVVDAATAVLDAAFMSMADLTLTVEPTISSQIGPYQMKMIQTVAEVDVAGTALVPIEFIAVEVEVTCTITEVLIPDAPAETQYLINTADVVIQLAPSFTQWPPCDYVLTEVLEWTFDPTPMAPATPTSDNPYEITIATADLTEATMYTMTLTDAVSYEAQEFTPSISFDIELIHPCRRAALTPPTIEAMTYTLRSAQNEYQ